MGMFDRLREAIGPDWGETNHFRCRDCEESFAYAGEIENPSCPYCDSTSLQVANER